MTPEILQIDNLSIGYSDQRPPKIVHENIRLTLKKGEFTCLLGTNGAGKSTLLKTLAGFQSPLGGKIILQSTDIHQFSRKKLARTLAVVLTDPIITGNLTVYEIVSFGRYVYSDYFGRLDTEDHKAVENALECVGITRFANRKLIGLSDGERQKVLIAKAIAQETPLILLDEPTAFLDLPSRVEIMLLLRKLTEEQGKTILLSTHDLDLAMQLADRIWLMAKKREIVEGAPEDLALSGMFNSFFDKEQLTFDVQTGSFRLTNRFIGTVRLKLEGNQRFWMEKALIRKGFKIVSDEIDSPIISFENEHYTLTINAETITCKTIEGLLSALK